MIGNQKRDAEDDDAAVMIPICRPCFAGDTKIMFNDRNTLLKFFFEHQPSIIQKEQFQTYFMNIYDNENI